MFRQSIKIDHTLTLFKDIFFNFLGNMRPFREEKVYQCVETITTHLSNLERVLLSFRPILFVATHSSALSKLISLSPLERSWIQTKTQLP